MYILYSENLRNPLTTVEQFINVYLLKPCSATIIEPGQQLLSSLAILTSTNAVVLNEAILKDAGRHAVVEKDRGSTTGLVLGVDTKVGLRKTCSYCSRFPQLSQNSVPSTLRPAPRRSLFLKVSSRSCFTFMAVFHLR